MKIMTSGSHEETLVTLVFEDSENLRHVRGVFEALPHWFDAFHDVGPRPACYVGNLKLSASQVSEFLDEESVKPGYTPWGKDLRMELKLSLPRHKKYFEFAKLHEEMCEIFRAPLRA